ncbi:hypothetical protein PPYR_03642 [Photinus pyralis]|nr:facilitated trehalose transporter Tret1-like [Photinus pyralis]XP_031331120.1 facilitated trehalose transporter Tret1-like [Photinus pyralis]KAB0791842.1 hypothetical protein PPYR_03642 [Photinus pyralis]
MLTTTMPPSEERRSFKNLVISCRSLSQYEVKNCKVLIPQLIAAVVAMCPNILVGITYAYSAIMVPQMMEEQNSTDPSVLHVSQNEMSWITSCLMLSTMVGALSAGVIMDIVGRLNMLKLMAVPSLLGWAMLALGRNVPMLIGGRILTGIALIWSANPTAVYITEISRPDVRGSFSGMRQLGVSLGMLFVYFKGLYLNWRIVAWMNCGYTVVFALLTLIVPESPVWLVSKNRMDQAKKSLEWFHKYQPQPQNQVASFAELQLGVLQKENVIKMKEREKLSSNSAVQLLQMFLQPTGYKPFLVMTGLYFFQQYCGIHLIVFNGVVFFKQIGTDIDPYIAASYVGGIRLAVNILNIYLTKRFNRRTLMMSSGIGMAVCMGTSGLYTTWLQKGTVTSGWIPLVLLMIYFGFAAIGFLTVPFSIQAEVFPLAIRSLAHAIISVMAGLISFAVLQTYFSMHDFFGGSSGLQYFFAIMSMGGFVFVLVFMPETHKKKLSEIEKYFWNHTTYLSVPQDDKEPTKQKSVELVAIVAKS